MNTDVRTGQSNAVGWLSLTLAPLALWLRVRYGWPPAWAPLPLLALGLAYPGPRRALGAVIGGRRSPAPTSAYADVEAPAPSRAHSPASRPRAGAPAWVRTWAPVGVGVLAFVGVLAWLLARAVARVSAGPLSLRWMAGAVVTVCVVAPLFLLLGRKRPGPHRTSPVKWWGVSKWRRSLPSRLADAVAEAGLVRRASSDADPYARTSWMGERAGHPDEAGQVLGRVELVGRPRWAGVGGAVLTLDLTPGRKLPEHVGEAVPVLRAHLRAAVVAVETVDGGVDTVRLHTYRHHPLRDAVDWRTLRPVDGGLDSGLAPFGRTAFAGRQSTVRWRLSTLAVSAPEQGKSADYRAMLAGLSVQSVPHRVWLLDNKADYRRLQPIAHRYATTPLDGLVMLREFVGVLDTRYERSAAFDSGYAHTPTLAEPLEVFLAGELLDFLAFKVTVAQARAAGEKGSIAELRAEAVELVGYVGRRMRGASGVFWTAAQGANKSGATEKIMEAVRDWFPQRIVHRLPDASMVAPAFGRPAEQAPAHEIAPSLRGVGYVLDDDTGLPILFRSAWVPPAEQDEAIVRPYWALMGAGPVIPGEVIIDGEDGAA